MSVLGERKSWSQSRVLTQMLFPITCWKSLQMEDRKLPALAHPCAHLPGCWQRGTNFPQCYSQDPHPIHQVPESQVGEGIS